MFVAAAKQSSSLPPPAEPEVAFAGTLPRSVFMVGRETRADAWVRLGASAGRSNVGKSSLINHLPIPSVRVVRVSDKPGLTQSINFFRLNRRSLQAGLVRAQRHPPPRRC